MSLPVNRFPNKLAPKVSNNIHNILRNLPFCSFSSFLIVLLAPFIYKPDSLRDLTIFIISFISSFEVINVAARKAKSEGREANVRDD